MIRCLLLCRLCLLFCLKDNIRRNDASLHWNQDNSSSTYLVMIPRLFASNAAQKRSAALKLSCLRFCFTSRFRCPKYDSFSIAVFDVSLYLGTVLQLAICRVNTVLSYARWRATARLTPSGRTCCGHRCITKALGDAPTPWPPCRFCPGYRANCRLFLITYSWTM